MPSPSWDELRSTGGTRRLKKAGPEYTQQIPTLQPQGNRGGPAYADLRIVGAMPRPNYAE
jgi:hypothetical protein